MSDVPSSKLQFMTPKKQSSKREQAEIDRSFAALVNAFAANRDVSRGKMMSSYGLKVNGKIFAMFGRNQFVTKLPKKRVDDLVSACKGKRFDPGHGRLMNEWIVVGAEKAEWVELAKEAYHFVKHGKEKE